MAKAKGEWVKRWRYTVWSVPVRPGIFRRQVGGFVLTTWTTTPAGKRRQAAKTIAECTVPEAQSQWDAFRREAEALAHGGRLSTMLFAEFALSLFQRKVKARDIRSAKGVRKWRDALKNHLVPRFGHMPVGAMKHGAIATWRAELAERVAAPPLLRMDGKLVRNPEHLSPRTCNTLFSIIRVITKAATIELDLDRDPYVGLAMFSTLEHPTYTDETPNSFTAEGARQFLATLRADYPQH